jgi:hypothetical protein
MRWTLSARGGGEGEREVSARGVREHQRAAMGSESSKQAFRTNILAACQGLGECPKINFVF